MTGSLTTQAPHAVPTGHEHGWLVESAHRTSDGIVQYVRCVVCGARRVDVAAIPIPVPAAASGVVG